MTRKEAAEMIRAVRNAPRGSEERSELVGWALTLFRANPMVRRLKIDHLLDTGEYDSADALIARALMRGNSREACGLMHWRFARSLHAQGRLESAWHHVTIALTDHPHHGGALQLAAQIARDSGDTATSVELLLRACALRPAIGDLRAHLVDALLAIGQTHEAAVELGRIQSPPPCLVSRVLRAQGRTLEAVELLEQAMAYASDTDAAPELHLALMAALEELGDERRLADAIAGATNDEPEAERSSNSRLRAAQAMLGQGHFDLALEMIGPLVHDVRRRRSALPVAIIAHTMLEQPSQAREAFLLWRQIEPAPSVDSMAPLWLFAIEGLILVEAVDIRSTGRDPSLGLLRPMLKRAATVLQHAVQDPTTQRQPQKSAACAKFRDACLWALGQASVNDQSARTVASRPVRAQMPSKSARRRAA
jgi:tetratricopeptide (TPR) repeat protein